MIGNGLAKLASIKVASVASLGISVFAVVGAIAWEIWHMRKHAKETQANNAKATEKFTHLQTKLDNLLVEQKNTATQIVDLQQKLSTLQYATATIPESPVTTFNKMAQPTTDASKLAMLKRVIDDNVQLRKSL